MTTDLWVLTIRVIDGDNLPDDFIVLSSLCPSRPNSAVASQENEVTNTRVCVFRGTTEQGISQQATWGLAVNWCLFLYEQTSDVPVCFMFISIFTSTSSFSFLLDYSSLCSANYCFCMEKTLVWCVCAHVSACLHHVFTLWCMWNHMHTLKFDWST